MIRDSLRSPTAGTDDGKGLFTADMVFLKQHIKNGGAIGVPVFFRSAEFDAVAPQHEVGEVVGGSGAMDTGRAIYEAAVAAIRKQQAENNGL